MPERFSVVGLISAPAPLSGAPGSEGYTWPRHRAMSRTADHAPWVIKLAMWQWARQQKSDPHKHLDEAISGMVEADLAATRARFTRTLDELSVRMQPDELGQDVSEVASAAAARASAWRRPPPRLRRRQAAR